MNPYELMQTLNASGIQVTLDNYQLRVTADKTVMTANIKQTLSENKHFLIEYLRNKQHKGICKVCGAYMLRSEENSIVYLDCPKEHYSSTFHKDYLPLKQVYYGHYSQVHCLTR